MKKPAKLKNLIIGHTYLLNGTPESELIYTGIDENNHHIFKYKNSRSGFWLRENQISEFIIEDDEQITLPI